MPRRAGLRRTVAGLAVVLIEMFWGWGCSVNHDLRGWEKPGS